MTYEESIRYIKYTDTLGSVLGLEIIKELLRRLGDPQDKVKVPYVHFWIKFWKTQDIK